MRWIFIGVVVLNLAYLVWHVQGHGQRVVASPPSGEVAAAPEFPQSLNLLDESGGAAAVANVANVRPPAGQAPVAGCPAAGPFSPADAESVARELGAAGYPAEVRQVDALASRVFWVYLPPAQTRETALRRLRELHARGIDSFVVASGEYERAISLGSFQRKDSATGVQSRLKAAGYAAEISEQVRDVSQTWVVLTEPDAQGFAEHIPSGAAAAAQVERLPCRAR